MRAGHFDQDWDPVVFRRDKPRPKKQGASDVGSSLRRVDRQEVGAPAKVSRKEGAAVARLRLSRGMSQQELAAAVRVRPKVIKDCEAGRAMRDPALMQRLRGLLGKLT